MSLLDLAAIGSFTELPYDAEAVWSVGNCTEEDMFAEDLFGEDPESVQYNKGSLSESGHLDLEADGYGYYVIDGSLKIDGILNLKIWDEYNPIVVVGNLTARGLVLHSEAHLYVLGKTKLTGPLVSDLGDGGACFLSGGFSAADVFDIGRNPPTIEGAKFDPQKLHERFHIDNCDNPIEAVFEALKAGKSIR